MFTSVCTLVYPPLPVSGYTCEPTGARVCAPGEHTPESAVAAPADVTPTPTTVRDTAAVTTVLSRRRLAIRELLSAEAVLTERLTSFAISILTSEITPTRPGQTGDAGFARTGARLRPRPPTRARLTAVKRCRRPPRLPRRLAEPLGAGYARCRRR